MPTQEQVLRLLEAGLDYREAAARLGVPAGQAFLIATGLPADGGDTLTGEEQRRPGMPSSSTQHLVNPAAENPTGKDSVRQWLKQRAAADTQMRSAAQRRDADPGSSQDTDETDEVTDLLTRDHDRVTALLKQLKTIPGRKKGGSPAQMSRRGSIVDMIEVVLAAHEPAEQQHLWPAVRRVLGDGDALADQALEQEREGTRTLAALAAAAPDTDEFDDLAEQLSSRLRRHVAFEDTVFAALRDALSADERSALGKKLRRARSAEPTRPHLHGTAETDP
ncbi:hemerythrin domain-containing protein [Streptomyces sp. NPDC051322]|uniref:hemerythrin domain-containing protein n=1 Tax=Streptomyces sp. NPDC051322 TaxID=3154645 RepID=UPI00344CC8A9